jgi:deoxyribose-phosphate aldolase
MDANSLKKIDEIRTYASRELVLAKIVPVAASTVPVRTSGKKPFASIFDHTVLKPEAGREVYENLCAEAKSCHTASVCLPPNRVPLAAAALGGSGVKVCTVIGFPLGYADTRAKVEEVRIALAAGCEEFDTVIPVGILKDGNIIAFFRDIAEVVRAAQGHLVKVILETCLLTDEEKILAGVTALLAGAHMLKTSTGFSTGGATVEDIRLLRAIAGKDRGVKASGGIRDYAFAKALRDAGADRIGASATVKILSESEEEIAP